MSGALRPGDRLAQRDGTVAIVDHIVVRPKRQIVYNIEVSGDHNYYISSLQLLVHNCPAGFSARKTLSPNQMDRAIQRGQAPAELKRVDIGKVTGEQANIYFENGAALNIDGTWKHGTAEITRKQAEWLQANGWKIP